MGKKRKENKKNYEKVGTAKKKSKSPLFTFRKYKKIENGKRHPKLIVGEIVENKQSKFEYMSLTSKKKK
ncbi:MAG: hypothetical protein IJZ29_04305 [Clostridia bacterium]|nr:hypothetical protein [Clostridia bacterium]